MSASGVPQSSPPTRRQPITGRGSIIRAGGETPVDLCDLSSEGVQIVVIDDLDVGEQVTVQLPGGGRYGAEVRWVRAGRAGLQFEAALLTWQLDQVIDGLLLPAR